MSLLVLDGALARCSAALFMDGVLVAEAEAEGARLQPTALPPLAARMLRGAPALTAVAVVVGPGSFTGLRAAIALAEGIALGAGVPLIGVTTGEALAAALPDRLRARHSVWSMVDTRRGRLVLEILAPGAWNATTPPRAMNEDDLPEPAGPIALVGDAAPMAAARLRAGGADVVLTDARCPRAADAGLVALRRLAGGIAPRGAAPIYVEPPHVERPGVRAPMNPSA